MAGASTERAVAEGDCGASPALFYEQAATIVGRVVKGALALVFAGDFERGAAPEMLLAAADAELASSSGLPLHAACNYVGSSAGGADAAVGEVEKANEDSCGEQSTRAGDVAAVLERVLQAVAAAGADDAATALHPTAAPLSSQSSSLAAVTFPLTPRRLLALRDRNHLAPPVAGAAKQQAHADAGE